MHKYDPMKNVDRATMPIEPDYFSQNILKDLRFKPLRESKNAHWERLQEIVAPPKGEIPVKLKRAHNAFLNKRNAGAWILKHHKNWHLTNQDINGDGVWTWLSLMRIILQS